MAPPHILATYYGDAATLEELLLHIGDDILDEHASGWCRGCSTGQTALQLAQQHHPAGSAVVQYLLARQDGGAGAGQPDEL